MERRSESPIVPNADGESERRHTSLAGVVPVLPSPFHADGSIDPKSLVRVARYCVDAGTTALLYPANASEVQALTVEERLAMGEALANELAGSVALVVGITSRDAVSCRGLVERALQWRASAVMIMPPPGSPDEVIAYLHAALDGCDLPVILQNADRPVGPALSPEAIMGAVEQVSSITYVKEESSPTGHRISRLLTEANKQLAGCFGGDGGRFVVNELRRGAIGFMPAADLVDEYVAIHRLHARGETDAAYQVFMRILPFLNFQRVYRWHATKRFLEWRGLIESSHVRIGSDGSMRSDLDTIDEDELTRFVSRTGRDSVLISTHATAMSDQGAG